MSCNPTGTASSQALQRIRERHQVDNPLENLARGARYAWVTYRHPEIREAMRLIRDAVHDTETILDNKLDALRNSLNLDKDTTMNKYVADLEERAPALFRGGTAEYRGEYQERETSTLQTYNEDVSRTVEEVPAQVYYTVTNRESSGKTQAGITVPIRDVADFEDALNERINQS